MKSILNCIRLEIMTHSNIWTENDYIILYPKKSTGNIWRVRMKNRIKSEMLTGIFKELYSTGQL